MRGPFYRSDAPFRDVRLSSPSEAGIPLTLTGRIGGGTECVPLDNAVLDVWQANARGLYPNMLGLGRSGDPRTFRLRGRFRTGADGNYRIETILPGHYPWPFRRARHIHFCVTSAGYSDLITQLFFAGDPYPGRDPWVKPSLVVALREDPGAGGAAGWRARFDFSLERQPNGAA